jgi:imidazolonepropionase-like amidohydrolase
VGRSSFALIGGTVIDGSGGDPVTRGVVVVEGNRIIAAGPEDQVAVPREAIRIDVSGHTVMPGLIDSHVHLASRPTFDIVEALTDTAIFAAVRGATFAAAMLQAGITSCRDAGAAGGVAIGLQRAIDAGVIPGPRIVSCGQLLAITGGGKWGRWLSEAFGTDAVEPHLTGPDAVRRAAREQIGQGATAVKLFVTGLLGDPSGGHDQQFSEEEIAAGVDEAHRQGFHAFAHAHGAAGAKNAIRAGVDSIEHGTYFDEEAVELMLEHCTRLVPTLSYWERLEIGPAPADLPPSYPVSYRQKGQEQYRCHQASFRMAVERGVTVAMGTDAGSELVNHDDGAFELAAMVRCGMTPMQAIVASTANAAVLLRLPETGRLQPGKLADVIVVDGDPLTDIAVLQDKERIALVVKDGEVYRDRIGSGLSRSPLVAVIQEDPRA